MTVCVVYFYEWKEEHNNKKYSDQFVTVNIQSYETSNEMNTFS